MPLRVVLLGLPGVGKGTQAKLLSQHTQTPHVSTGDIIRSAIQAKTPLGVTAEEYMKAGNLVPDDVVIGVIQDWMKSENAINGFLLDGFPRTVPQAEALETILKENEITLDAVLYFTAPIDVVKERLYNRAKIEGRADDSMEVIEQRIKVYQEQTLPLIEFYKEKNLLKEIDGTSDIETVFGFIKEKLHL